MIRRIVDIEGYWKVIVYTDIGYNFSSLIKELIELGVSKYAIKTIKLELEYRKIKAVTISNLNKRRSVIIFGYHKYIEDYINSIVHESEHVKQSMLEYYQVEDKDEDAAYTVGYIASKIIQVLMLKI